MCMIYREPMPLNAALHNEDSIMRQTLRAKIIQVCDAKIAVKGSNVGLSFYAFFANKNDDPELLMEAARWWIQDMRLDHFEKAVKIKALVESME
ncbi:Uncharacterised protein [Yersinia frederiksenii]|nr:Uncharacterised protein [Yersinia frederiksenii]